MKKILDKQINTIVNYELKLKRKELDKNNYEDRLKYLIALYNIYIIEGYDPLEIDSRIKSEMFSIKDKLNLSKVEVLGGTI